MQRYGDWNSKNRALWEETQRLGGNKYREIYKQLIKQRMNFTLGFGSNEEAFEEKERRFVEDYLNEHKTKQDDYDWYVFSEECIEGLKKALKERTDEYKRLDAEYKTATEYPDRYSYYYFTVLHDCNCVAVLFKFMHTNRKHALSPDGWALLKTEPVFAFKAND
jgi:hypothetical protein